jgi:hypothetical protein
MAATVRPRPRLDELPEELVSNIVVKLDSDSSFAFRLTCRVLEHRSLHEWASEYFGQKAIIPSSASLKVLASIAESEKLRVYVHHLYIIPAKFSPRSVNCCMGKNCKWKHTVRQEEAMCDLVNDQKDLKRDGKLVERLTHVFKHLPSLHGVSFTDSVGGVPPEVDIHGRASYTRTTNNILTTLPTDPYDKEYYAWKSYVWKATMQSIALSGISTLKVLSTGLDNVKNPLTLNDINFSGRTLHHLSKTLRNIESLRLQITTRSTTNLPGEEEGFDKAKAMKVTKDFASLMPSIEILHLTFSYSPMSATLCRNFLANMTISKLNTLRLDSAYIDSKFLGTFMLGLVNVESLFLEWIELTKGEWPVILEALNKLKKLNHLHLTSLTVASGAACFLKELEPEEAARDTAQNGWDLFGPFSLNGGGTGAGISAAGAAHPPLDIQGSSSSEFITDEEDEDEDEDEDGEDEDDSGEDDDSMPELEPQTEEAPAHPTQPPPSLTQVLSSLYPDSDAETDNSMPELEPQTEEAPSQSAAQPAPPLAAATTNTTHNNNHDHDQQGPSNAPQAPLDPGSLESRLGRGVERGRVICLNTSKEIQEQLPRFIKEYHIVDAEDEMDDDLLGGMPIAIPVGGLGAGGGAGPGAAAGAGNANGAAADAGLAPPPTTNAIMNHLHALMTANPNGGTFTISGPPGAGQGHGHGHSPALPPSVFGPPPPAISTNTDTAGGGSDEDWTGDDY